VTISFLFLVCLLVGLVVAGTSGLLRRITAHRVCHDVTMPAPEHHTALLNLIARRISPPLAVFGAAGLLLRHSDVQARVIWSLAAALAAGLVAMLVFREWSTPVPAATAVVVRAIPVNGFGQVQVEQGGRTILLAAKSIDGSEIPAGSAIEMVDCESSVLTVKVAGAAATAA
jgi:hypothetical protein